jgi:hypothetical protein
MPLMERNKEQISATLGIMLIKRRQRGPLVLWTHTSQKHTHQTGFYTAHMRYLLQISQEIWLRQYKQFNRTNSQMMDETGSNVGNENVPYKNSDISATEMPHVTKRPIMILHIHYRVIVRS